MNHAEQYNQIMNEIVSGLTNDPMYNIHYLQQQGDKYKNHPLSKEILRECGRLLHQNLPHESSNRICNAFEEEHASFIALLNSAIENLHSGNHAEAFRILEAKIHEVEFHNLYDPDQESEYYSFEELFEEILFKENNKRTKVVRRAPFPYSNLYDIYGTLLFEVKRYPEAQIAFQKALKWNPQHLHAFFEYAEIYRATGKLEQFYLFTRNALKMAFHAADIARCYRNIGFYLIEKGDYAAAIVYFSLSMVFEESDLAKSELLYIYSVSGQKPEPLTNEILEHYGQKYDLPIGPHPSVIQLLYQHANWALESQSQDLSKYFLSLIYEITSDEEILEKLKLLE